MIPNYTHTKGLYIYYVISRRVGPFCQNMTIDDIYLVEYDNMTVRGGGISQILIYLNKLGNISTDIKKIFCLYIINRPGVAGAVL